MTSFLINEDDGKLTLMDSVLDLEQPIMVSFSQDNLIGIIS